MTTYVAGPMTGIPEHNYPVFTAAVEALRADGVEVVSPHEIDDGGIQQPWSWYMRKCLVLLAGCDEIVMLPGWEESRGACIEHTIAEILELPATYLERQQRTCQARHKLKPAWRCLLPANHETRWHDYAGSRWTARDEPAVSE